MSKETEKRLIKTLEFLKEPQGSTIPTIVKAINGNDPKISLKRIVQTLKGCLENGVVKVADGRIKLKQMGGLSDGKSDKNDKSGGLPDYCSRPKNPCQKPMSKCPKTCQGTTPKPGNGSPEPSPQPENPDNPENPKNPSPEDPKCKPKPKSKPKPKCPKPKKKCPKPKCPKPKKKPKCKPKPKKKCAPKKKIQPYCKKKKKCSE